MGNLNSERKKISRIDRKMTRLFEKRMRVAKRIGEEKARQNLPVRDEAREDALLSHAADDLADPTLAPYACAFRRETIALSRAYQTALRQKDARFVMTSAGGYPVFVKCGALDSLRDVLPRGGKTLLVTDDGVPAALVERVSSALSDVRTVCLPAGESLKSADNLLLLCREMAREGFSRGDAVLSLGGGTVSDLAGFAASIYMRGIAFYQIPTTLLAQVDASVGGKTAIDDSDIKNIFGTFYPPRAVIVDPDVLKTLPPRQIASGLAEIIKIAATCDPEFFLVLESGAFEENPEAVIRIAISMKAQIVERDEKEENLRRVLNFGHTLGHALESAASPAMLHGECVALGMLPMCSPAVNERLRALFSRYGLPVEPPVSIDAARAVAALFHDKKADGEQIQTVFVPEIGQYEFRRLSRAELENKLREVIS